MKYSLIGVGLDTSTIKYKPEVNDVTRYNYYHTSISANNEYLLSDLISMNEEATLITTIDFIDKSWEAINEHLLALRRECIDFLLIDSKCDFNKYKVEVKTLIGGGTVTHWGISNPSSVNELESIQKLIGNIDYISLDLSPLNFNYEVIKWCKDNGVNIFCFNSLGGELSSNVLIDGFTLPYLLNFAAVYGFIVFVSGRDLDLANKNKTYLRQLIDKEIENDKIYMLDKTVDKLTRPIKHIIKSSLRISDGLILSYENNSYLFNHDELVLNIKKIPDILADIEDDELANIINKYYSEIEKPADVKTDLDVLSIIRPRVFKLFKEYYNGWNNQMVALDNNTFILSAILTKEKKRIFSPNILEVVKEQTYILKYKEGNFLFQKCRNSVMKPSES